MTLLGIRVDVLKQRNKPLDDVTFFFFLQILSAVTWAYSGTQNVERYRWLTGQAGPVQSSPSGQPWDQTSSQKQSDQ